VASSLWPLANQTLALGDGSVIVIIKRIIQLARWRPKGGVDAKAG
jgi:hypothetical protein